MCLALALVLVLLVTSAEGHRTPLPRAESGKQDVVFEVSNGLYSVAGLPPIAFAGFDAHGVEFLRDEVLANLDRYTSLEAIVEGTLGLDSPARTPIPSDISKLCALGALLLDNAAGTVPTQMGLLTRLHLLEVTGVDGRLPSEFGLLTSLEFLWASTTGSQADLATLPTQLALLTNLETLGLFCGAPCTLPPGVLALPRLRQLALHESALQGTLPTQLGLATSLILLQLYANDLVSSVPSQVGLLQSVVDVLLSDNRLDGTLPSQLGQLSAAGGMGLGHNLFHGPIPSQLGLATSVASLNLGYNQLSGPLPSQLGQLWRAIGVEAGGNALDGAIPSQLGLMGGRPELVDLADNRLTGPLPSQFGQLTLLRRLLLNDNALEGTLPSQLGNLPFLHELALHNNPNITDTIPSWFGRLASLATLRLHDCALRGTLPTQLGLLAQLTDLRLTANSLHGPLPLQLVGLGALAVLWVDHNALSGTVPAALTRGLATLADVRIAHNAFQGRLDVDVASPWLQHCEFSGITRSQCERGCLRCGVASLTLRECGDDGQAPMCVHYGVLGGVLAACLALVVFASFRFGRVNRKLRSRVKFVVLVLYALVDRMSDVLFALSTTGIIRTLAFCSLAIVWTISLASAVATLQKTRTVRGVLNNALTCVATVLCPKVLRVIVRSRAKLVALQLIPLAVLEGVLQASLQTVVLLDAGDSAIAVFALALSVLTVLTNIAVLVVISLSDIRELVARAPAPIAFFVDDPFTRWSVSGKSGRGLSTRWSTASLGAGERKARGEEGHEEGRAVGEEEGVELGDARVQRLPSGLVDEGNPKDVEEGGKEEELAGAEKGAEGEGNLDDASRESSNGEQVEGNAEAEGAELAVPSPGTARKDEREGGGGGEREQEGEPDANGEARDDDPLVVVCSVERARPPRQGARGGNGRRVATTPSRRISKALSAMCCCCVLLSAFLASNTVPVAHEDRARTVWAPIPITVAPGPGELSRVVQTGSVAPRPLQTRAPPASSLPLTISKQAACGPSLLEQSGITIKAFGQVVGLLAFAPVLDDLPDRIRESPQSVAFMAFPNLRASIPAEIGLLVNCRIVYVGMCEGALPTQIGHMTNLGSLQLLLCAVSSPVPTQLGLLSSLTHLRLSQSLRGPLPSQLGLVPLGELALTNFHLGAVPSQFGAMSGLSVLDVPGLEASGGILEHVNPNWELLNLQSNAFSGTLSTEMGILSTLGMLDCSNNLFSGPLPSQLGQVASASYFGFSANHLSGSLPSQLGTATALAALLLNDNALSGLVPSQIGSLSLLTALSLASNAFEGQVPSQVGLLTALASLELGNNHFNGTVPSQLGALSRLTTLGINGNALSGTLPSQLALLTSLHAVAVHANQLSGGLPGGMTAAQRALWTADCEYSGLVVGDECARKCPGCGLLGFPLTECDARGFGQVCVQWYAVSPALVGTALFLWFSLKRVLGRKPGRKRKAVLVVGTVFALVHWLLDGVFISRAEPGVFALGSAAVGVRAFTALLVCAAELSHEHLATQSPTTIAKYPRLVSCVLHCVLDVFLVLEVRTTPPRRRTVVAVLLAVFVSDLPMLALQAIQVRQDGEFTVAATALVVTVAFVFSCARVLVMHAGSLATKSRQQ